MKNFTLLAAFFTLLLCSCSNGGDDPVIPAPAAQSFTFDNQNYTVLQASGINELKMDNFSVFNGISYNRSQISIIGMIGFSQTATIAFDLFYREGSSLAGTYTIYNTDDSDSGFEDFVSPLTRGCLGWTSLGNVFLTSGAEGVNANNPSGTLTVTVNATNNYTIHFSGNFRIYDNDFNVVRQVPCAMDITGSVTQQN